MPFCNSCQKVARAIISELQDGAWESDPPFKIHKKSIYEGALFEELAESCELCRMIVAFYKSSERELPTRSIALVCVGNSLNGGSRSEIFMAMPNAELHMALWGDAGDGRRKAAGSPASTLPPILDNDPEHNAPTVSEFIKECLARHEDCRKNMSERIMDDDGDNGGVPLPTRVLSVSGGGDGGGVKLVETNGQMTGRYCALSHCWGPPGKRPLRTTPENFRQHLDGIPLMSLPKTFREAVLLARALGIDYLWIDSLCVIQDNAEDWEREAKAMASVYGNAFLVIAAAGSRDSSEGLFVAERPKPSMTVELPYGGSSEEGSSVFLTLLPDQRKILPEHNLLRQRGWCMQEAYLARRVIFAMPGGLLWRCRERVSNERGLPLRKTMAEHTSWLSFLQEYSKSKLTYPTDRLVAIQGVVEAVQKRQITQRQFRYGVWEDCIVEEVLWSLLEPVAEEDALPALPSWCWASNGSDKSWCLENVRAGMRIKSWEALSVKAGIKDAGVLDLTGATRRCKIRPAAVGRCCTDTIAKETYGFLVEPERHIMRRDDRNIPPVHLLFDDAVEGQQRVNGLAVFDRGAPSSSITAILLTQVYREEYSALRPGSYACFEEPVHNALPDCVDLYNIARVHICGWALLLEPTGEHEKQYRRVGIGLFYDREAWDQLKIESIEVV